MSLMSTPYQKDDDDDGCGGGSLRCEIRSAAPSVLSVSLIRDESNITVVTVEKVVTRWMMSSLSNVQLAILSNVSRVWRQAVVAIILEQSLTIREEEDVTIEGKRTPLLLLPSMVHYMMRRPNYHHEVGKHKRNGVMKRQDYDNETFCVAWFVPQGIQEQDLLVSIDDEENHDGDGYDYDDDEYGTENSFMPGRTFQSNGVYFQDGAVDVLNQNFVSCDQNNDVTLAPSNVKPALPQQQLLSARNSQCSRTPSGVGSNSIAEWEDLVPTCYEWQGYSSAMEILHPFGYTPSFVETVLRSAKERISEKQVDKLESTLVIQKSEIEDDVYMAVRGAHLARPESYCLCVDADSRRLTELRVKESQRRSNRTLDTASTQKASHGNSNNNQRKLDHYNGTRFQEYKQFLIRKERRRRELQREVLPRILLRQFLPHIQQKQHRQCVQFLNASGSHAVCMMTPPFHCGPIAEPVTILCVAIATEDGCFLSGLHRRFELGHLYPNDNITRATELSPVCLSTEYHVSDSFNVERQPKTPCRPQTYRSSSDDDDEDDDEEGGSSSCVDEDSHHLCECIFRGSTEKRPACLDETKPRALCRGRMLPGSWHCYTAVYDGAASFIRVDGVPESSATCMFPGKAVDGQSPQSRALLDGMTIGSDHTFGMSLCCGDGSGGEGEGAIAELAVFSGRLALSDLQVLESSVMSRHGIVPTQMSSIDLHWKECEWSRQAHALFCLSQLDGEGNNMDVEKTQSVPLRYLSRHRSVAWQLANPGTMSLD